jgi:hypothetical protein
MVGHSPLSMQSDWDLCTLLYVCNPRRQSVKAKLKIVPESRQPINVIFCREVYRITAYIDPILSLVNAYIVNPHVHRKCQAHEVDGTKIFGHSQVGDEILHNEISSAWDERHVPDRKDNDAP